jgi:hypothetical protein
LSSLLWEYQHAIVIIERAIQGEKIPFEWHDEKCRFLPNWNQEIFIMLKKECSEPGRIP